ncbi:Serine-enriched protein-like [Oopsacas minuta]|uniref:Serine-enriched protein-like n=1 Tax=Oopsacas minuta TaxID=111878 RepID=A0AAV7JED0_9METZ|nr:Serine-enriched protein-like [Oopsacas minuta]
MSEHDSSISYQEAPDYLSWPYPSDTLCGVPCSNTFDNKSGLSDDLAFLTSMPEFCDVTFLAGEPGEPVQAVRAILAARSRVMKGILLDAANGYDSLKSKKNKKKGKKGKNRRSVDLVLSIPMRDFDADTFRELIQYLHTGKCLFQPSTVIGLMNACDYFGIDELKRACLGYINRCVEVDTVLTLLGTAEQYISHKYTKIALKPILEFIDTNAEEILSLDGFASLSEHVAILVFGREQLQVSSYSKFQAALSWCQYHKTADQSLSDTFSPFVDYVALHEIPAMQLMTIVKPSGAVKQELILNALAFQADPESVDISRLSSRQRLNSFPALYQSMDVIEENTPPKLSLSYTGTSILQSISTPPPKKSEQASPVPKISRTLPSTPEEEPASSLQYKNKQILNKPPHPPKPSTQDVRSRLDGSNVHINNLKFHADKTVSETALNTSLKQPIDISPIDCVIESFRSSSQLSDSKDSMGNTMDDISLHLSRDDDVIAGSEPVEITSSKSVTYKKSYSDSSDNSEHTKSTLVSPLTLSLQQQQPRPVPPTDGLYETSSSSSEGSLGQLDAPVNSKHSSSELGGPEPTYCSSHSSLYSDGNQAGDMSDISQVSFNDTLLPKLKEVALDPSEPPTNQTWTDSFDSSDTPDPSPKSPSKSLKST